MILNRKSEILKCINHKLKEIVPPPPNPLFGHIISRSSNKQTHFDRVSAFVCKTHIWQTFRSNNIFLHFSPCCSCSTRQPVAASHSPTSRRDLSRFLSLFFSPRFDQISLIVTFDLAYLWLSSHLVVRGCLYSILCSL